jgi:hypothetical protein
MEKKALIDIILAVFCTVALIVSAYDIYNLQGIRNDVLDKCNDHWIKEFKTKCTAYISSDKDYGSLNFSIKLNNDDTQT